MPGQPGTHVFHAAFLRRRLVWQAPARASPKRAEGVGEAQFLPMGKAMSGMETRRNGRACMKKEGRV